jgi:Putative Ig domain
MQATTLRLRSVAWGRRVMPAAIALGLLLLFGFAQSGFAQNAPAAGGPPLTFGNNFFVTGDYAIGGTGLGKSNMGFASGTISIGNGKDTNPGVAGTNSVPQGAQIVAALLYWQTAEIVGGATGQKGFFRGYQIAGTILSNPKGTVYWTGTGCASASPTSKQLVTYRADVRGLLPQDANGNVTANGDYQVTLASQSNGTPITFGATLVLVYRVLFSTFPLNAVVIYDGTPASTSNIALKMQGFYDAATKAADFPPGGGSPVSKLTYIVANGRKNLNETVFLNTTSVPNNPLPNLYKNLGLPPLPGWYGTWDNATWFSHGAPLSEDDSSVTTVVESAQQGCVTPAAIIYSTTVKNSDGDGLLDVWKVPTAPHDSTIPGYCDASVNEGVCKVGDASWVDLPGAVHGEKDVFIQLDYMCSSVTGADTCSTTPGNYSFDPRQTGADVMMTNAFLAQGIHLHINPVNPMGTTQPVHAIQEQTCVDNNPSNSPLCAPTLQPFPNQPGVVGWKGGFEVIKSQPVNYQDESSCEQALLHGPCIRRFQYGRKDSYHYALFAHAVGAANWGLQGGSLASVVASNNTVKFTTSAPHGLVVDPNLGNGRVTIADAITNPNLNGTYLVSSVSPPAGVLNITGTSMSAQGTATYNFTQVSGPAPVANDLVTVTNTTNGSGVFNVGNATIASVSGSTFTVDFHVNGFMPSAILQRSETGGCAPALPTGACAHTNRSPFFFTISVPNLGSPQGAYTQFTDPNLTVTSGQASTGSGFSDTGGADTLVTLGLWGNPAFNGSSPATSPASDGQKATVQAGTFMHELGHTLGLTHGGLFFDNLAQNPPDYTPTLDANCKSNYQSVMNYMFQTDLLGPSNVLDFSSQQLRSLNETSLMPIATTDGSVKFSTTTWYDLTPNFRIDPLTHLPVQVGSKAKHHCDGSPMFFNANVPPFSADVTPIMYPHLNQALPSPWSANSLDINFDGTIDTSVLGFRGYNDWANVNLLQIGATGSDTSGPGKLGGTPGKLGGTPGKLGGTPGKLGGTPGKPAEIDFGTANDVTRPPRNLMASEEVSPRFIDLSWTAPIFGQIGAYRIYRSADGGATFSLIATVPGSQITYRDGVTNGVTTPPPCNTTGYQYFVTAVLAGTFAAFPPGSTEGQESEPSNTVSSGQNSDLLTACYTPGSPLFASLGAPLAGSDVTVKWTVLDASNKVGTSAKNPSSNSLFAIGPISNDVACVGSGGPNTPRSQIAPLGNGNGIVFDGTSQFSFPWHTSQGFNGTNAAFPPGCYRLELDLDSGQPTSGNLPASAFQVQFYLSDSNESVLVTTTSPLPGGTVGVLYNQQLQETGGVMPLNWTVVSGSLPPGTPPAPSMSLISGTGVLSGYAATAGTYPFTVQATDSIGDFGTQPLTLTVHIFVSASQPPAIPPFTATMALPNGVVGSPYNNTVYESGGVSNDTTAFSWTIVPNSVMPGGGSTLPGVSFQPNAIGVTNGTLFGTPPAPGTYTFTAMVTDSAGNTGTQMLTLNVADALFGDLVVVDGGPAAMPTGTLLRVTQAGTPTGTIATISTGQPTGVAVDASTGNIYATVAPVAGIGMPGVTQVTQFGTVNNSFVSGGPLQNPVSVAVDASKNVYVADSKADAIYKFDSTGTQVGANGTATASAFASLPSSVMHVRMAFATNGNLIVASDKVNGASGVIEVDQINTSTGTPTVLYNTTTNAGLTDTLTAVNASANITSFSITSNVVTFQATNNFAAGTMVQISGLTTGTYLNGQTLTVLSAGLTGAQFEANFNNPDVTSTNDSGTATSLTAAYTGTFSPPLSMGSPVAISGFTNNGNNSPINSPFTVVSCTSTTLVVNNPNGVTETHAGTATFGIASVGGVATFSDGSIDVADSSTQTIYKITTTPSLAVAPDISTTNALCCNISGMTNPSQGTTLFVTLDQTVQVQKAVPPSTVTTILNGTPLTFPNDVATYSKP